MICVTIGRGRHSSLAEEWKAAAEAGAELVELRIDCLRRDPDLKRILSKRLTPIVFTLRRSADGGLWRGNEEKRQQLLREAIAMGVDYVDLEVDIAPKIRRYGKTKRIISYHNLKKTPADIEQIAEQCDEIDADVVKVATSAASLGDASRVLALGKKAKVPTVLIAMGAVGAFTRVLNAKYGSPFTYAGFNPERTFAPGMLKFQTLKRDYFYDEINADTEVYAVIGDPIEQSLSPAIHNASFRHLGLNKVLVPIHVPAGRLAESLKELAWLDIKGFSVTIPHKEELVKLLDQKDGAVERTGSCNTLIPKDGKKIGYNTDYRAAMDSLENAMRAAGATGSASPLDEKQILILGAGGAARSIAFGVARRGAHLQIANRHEERAAALAEEVGCRVLNWSQRASTIADVIINCTPVGMHPNVDDTPVPPATFSRPGMIAFDTVYHPENTMFLKLARERDCGVVTGVEMFVRQAAEQFKLYTGQDAPQDVMRGVLQRKLGAIRES
ncbi:shikimate dehydrogenase [Singulisphaera sp. PoT]|uniref:shikimate dehydrogenase n=1 Tax=Singulisphaera sp. PoT TaxID=3411797 RepID=UPI003BF4EDCA